MLAGFLTVLKIIGIVLLWILLIVLFLILLVLFVPVRYKADANIPETELDKGFDLEKMHIKAGFSWLLHLISGGIDYPESKEFTIRVFGIKVFPRKNKDSKVTEQKTEDDLAIAEEENIDNNEDEILDNNADKDTSLSSDNSIDNNGNAPESNSANFTENSE